MWKLRNRQSNHRPETGLTIHISRSRRRLILLILVLLAFLAVTIRVGWFFFTPNHAIKGLTLKQNGTSIQAKWTDSGANGYRILVRDGLSRHSSLNSNTSSVTIPNVKPTHDYTVMVLSKEKDGDLAAARTATIHVNKLTQTIQLPSQISEGLSGDHDSLDAKSQGKLTYSSSNEKVATVNKKGQVTYHKTGQATIKVKAAGTENYKAGSQQVAVTVYPEKLDKPTLTAKAVKADGDSEVAAHVKMSWEAVPYAKKYLLQKKSADDGDYETLETVKAEAVAKDSAGSKSGSSDTMSITIPRDKGKYRLMAVAKLAVTDSEPSTTVKSPASSAVSVHSAAEDAPAYSDVHILDTLSLDDFHVTSVSGTDSASIAQSFAWTGDHYVVSFINRGDSAGALVSYSKDGKRLKSNAVSGIGHANGTTCNPNTGKIYVVQTTASNKTNQCRVFDMNSLADQGTISLPRRPSGIAYDESLDKYFISGAQRLEVLTSDFGVEKYIGKSVRYHQAQDIGAYNGVALCVTWTGGAQSYVDLYRGSDGAYLGSYDIPLGEVESATVVDKHLAVLVHNTREVGGSTILRTKEPIPLP